MRHVYTTVKPYVERINECDWTTLLDGATVYVTMYPCNECAKLIIQSGIKEVVYFEGKLTGLEPPPTTTTPPGGEAAVPPAAAGGGVGVGVGVGVGAGGGGGGDGSVGGGVAAAAAAAAGGDEENNSGNVPKSGTGTVGTVGTVGSVGTGTGIVSSPTKGGMQADPTYAAAGKLLNLAKVCVRQHTPSATIDITYD